VTVEIRRGSTRSVEREPGRVTRHSFSFGADYDPTRLSFGPMVCHDDHLLGPGRGFETHRHSGLEIVTYVVSGSLRHTDSTGSVSVVPAGSAAVLSTGDGVEHSEFATADGPCRFVQVWLRASGDGAAPSYDVRAVTPRTGAPVPIAQPRADAVLWLLRLDGNAPVELPEADRVHVYVVTGALLRSSLAEPLSAGDAFEMTSEPARTVAAGVPTELLVWTFYDNRPPPVLMGSEGGAWMAFAPVDGSDLVESDEPPVGRIRLMGDFGGAFLWDEEGCIGGGEGDFDYLHRHLGLSRALYDDLARWGEDWDGQANTPEHDARARELLERLRAECPAYDFELRL
jgi:redox-sensitive bicupin YhaK (pirin superfamily)